MSIAQGYAPISHITRTEYLEAFGKSDSLAINHQLHKSLRR